MLDSRGSPCSRAAFDDACLQRFIALWDRASGMDGGDSLLEDGRTGSVFCPNSGAGAIVCLNRNVVLFQERQSIGRGN